LRSDSDFLLPQLFPDLSTQQILTMSFVEGVPVEDLLSQPQGMRDRVMSLLFMLLFKEIFEFRLVQTDPNFANYRFNLQTNQLVLLDFGACRDYSIQVSEGYRLLFRALLQQDVAMQLQALQQIGYFSTDILPAQQQAVLALVGLAAEPLQQTGAYDFATSELAGKMREVGLQLSMQLQYWHTPPVDALFLHRKMAGLFLLAKTLKARVDVRSLLLPFIDTAI
jgi:predicted unusual protein kinase regulating ubiquinone biosynthesis (AarF/ABC1/UbiB family)